VPVGRGDMPELPAECAAYHRRYIIGCGSLVMVEGDVGVTKKGIRCRCRDAAALATPLPGTSRRLSRSRTFQALTNGKDVVAFDSQPLPPSRSFS